jgi:hypothetical protein
MHIKRHFVLSQVTILLNLPSDVHQYDEQTFSNTVTDELTISTDRLTRDRGPLDENGNNVFSNILNSC